MPDRQVPYGAFNFLVRFDGSEAFGGFSDVSGLGTEITVAEYRNGNDPENHVRKIPGVHKVSDVTLCVDVTVSTTFGTPEASTAMPLMLTGITPSEPRSVTFAAVTCVTGSLKAICT